jgi:hypothetical protein
MRQHPYLLCAGVRTLTGGLVKTHRLTSLAVLLFLAFTCHPVQAQKQGTHDMGGFGFAVSYDGRITSPGIYFSQSWGSYRLDGPVMNASFVTHDPYNGDKGSISALGLLNWGAIALAGVFHSDDVGTPAAKVISAIVLVPSVILNGEHHLRLADIRLGSAGARTQASAFAKTHSDYFMARDSSGTSWFSFNYGLGAEVRLLGNQREQAHTRLNIIGVQCGLQWAHDLAGSDPMRNLGRSWFFGLKLAWDN